MDRGADARAESTQEKRLTRRAFLSATLVGLSGLAGASLLVACQTPAAPAAPTPAPAPTAAPAPATAAAPTPVPAATAPAGLATVAAAVPTAVAVGEPRPGGTLSAAAEVDPISFDPHVDPNFSAVQAFDHVYESLTAYDERLGIIPSLAERWQISDDTKSYTFELREAKFHNGQPLTAEDVKYSIDRVLDPKTAAPYASWLGPVKEVRVVNPRTVQFSYDVPFPGLLGGLAGMRASAIMPTGFAEKENVKLKAIGTGPFKLVEFAPQDHITYEKNIDYWNPKYPYFDGMSFKILTEENARLAALRAGQIHYAALSAQGIEQLGNAPGFRVLKGPAAWIAITLINVSKPPMDDPRVRRALRMAVDTQEVIDKAVYGAGVASGCIPTGYGDWYLDPASLPYLKADIEGAKKLLAEAGFPEGKGMRLQMMTSPQYPEFPLGAAVIQESWKRIGVEVEVEQLEWGTYVQREDANDFQLAHVANTFRPDPDGYVYADYHSKGKLNRGGYSNPKLDQLIERARTIADLAERRSLYQEIGKILLEDSPSFWWYTKFNVEAISEKLQGYAQSFTGRRLFLYKSWLVA